MESLYPLKFEPIFKKKIWGGNRIKQYFGKEYAPEQCGESWEISGLQGDLSVISNGFLAGNNIQEIIEVYMADLVGEKIYEKFGIEFPLLIKFIDSHDSLSVQVHPDDQTARRKHKAYGKTEMWYVVEAKENAELIMGFNRNIDKNIFLEHVANGSITEILNFEKVEKKDAFFIPAGRVHALLDGILLVEIQQASDITYRIYDWDRVDSNGIPRDLHLDLAVDVIDYKKYDTYKIPYKKDFNKVNNIVKSKYFVTNYLIFDEVQDKDYGLLDSFVVYICTDGSFTIDYATGKEKVKKGETVLLPAVLDEVKLIPETNAEVIEVYINL